MPQEKHTEDSEEEEKEEQQQQQQQPAQRKLRRSTQACAWRRRFSGRLSYRIVGTMRTHALGLGRASGTLEGDH